MRQTWNVSQVPFKATILIQLGTAREVSQTRPLEQIPLPKVQLPPMERLVVLVTAVPLTVALMAVRVAFTDVAAAVVTAAGSAVVAGLGPAITEADILQSIMKEEKRCMRLLLL